MWETLLKFNPMFIHCINVCIYLLYSYKYYFLYYCVFNFREVEYDKHQNELQSKCIYCNIDTFP